MDPLPGPLAGRVKRLAGRFSGRFGLWFQDLRGGRSAGLDADQCFPAASTIKLFVLRELYRRAQVDELDLEDLVQLTKPSKVSGSGVIKDLGPGLRLTLHDAATLMITVSDNTATNLLIERLGTRSINREAARAGYTGSHLGGKLFKGRGLKSWTTPSDLGRFMTSVARGHELSREASRDMLDILLREQYDNIVGRLIPVDEESSEWRVASKSGSLRGVRNDVAFVRGRRDRYVIALMSQDCADRRFWVDNEATIFLAKLARLVHHHLTPIPPRSPELPPASG